jgi:hypothetical protein
MMPPVPEYKTRDRPAERGITINNILLAIVVLGGSVFGTVVTSLMAEMQTDVKQVKETITTIRVQDGITSNELSHVHDQLKKCEGFHRDITDRLKRIELRVFGGRSQNENQ